MLLIFINKSYTENTSVAVVVLGRVVVDVAIVVVGNGSKAIRATNVANQRKIENIIF